MKYYVLTFLLAVLLLSSCNPSRDDYYVPNTTGFTGVIIDREELERSIVAKESREIEVPGKIYTYGSYIYISERYMGVHVIDNTDPLNPVNVKFIQVPGCLDLAVNENVMFVNSARDLVSIDIADLNNPKVLSRNRNVFDDVLPPNSVSLPYEYQEENRPKDTEIIRWEK